MLHACVLNNQSVAGDLRQAPVHMYVSNHLPTTSPAKQPKKQGQPAKHPNEFTQTGFCYVCCDTHIFISQELVFGKIHSRADSRLVPSQWETSLQSNGVSHWLSANQKSSLHLYTGNPFQTHRQELGYQQAHRCPSPGPKYMYTTSTLND